MNGGASTTQSRYSKGKDEHEADAFLYHYSDPLYGLALEVAYSQKRGKVLEKAKFYILECERETPIVVCIDYDYGRSKKVTLLTWRRDGDEMSLTNYTQVSLLFPPQCDYLLRYLGSSKRRRCAHPW